jgi:hypothetical protein
MSNPLDRHIHHFIVLVFAKNFIQFVIASKLCVNEINPVERYRFSTVSAACASSQPASVYLTQYSVFQAKCKCGEFNFPFC